MEKRIFTEHEAQAEPDIQPKQEFHQAEIVAEDEAVETEAELILEQSMKPPRFWLRVLMAGGALFVVALFAQSIQWLVDTYQQHQWIYFAFAIAFFLVSLAGVGAIVNEWRKLVFLRKHQQNQELSRQYLLEDLPNHSGQDARALCDTLLTSMQPSAALSANTQKWQAQLDEAYNAKEVLYLFSETVLAPIDKQVKKQISKSATENAVIVAVSPLAIADMLIVAWRNIALINKITKSYGMELGYWSRLRLFKMVLMNMAFAGATEFVTDVGMDWFSQNLTAKLSVRAAQGIGVGLLTARLGIKAMEFCRPLAFQAGERPKLSVVRQELLSALKETVFAKAGEKEKVY